ncbi:hypothetical protein BIW11_03393 [Tropilaelaps mercedesae]|uniref:Uncharacterized protein n=1 Tax=Tropilaelaps mercedesae TaxID=418985 RepID=A0A1V9XMM5_9ACAR|nr:hypothetical protein BIW11_03393 [Tropilaelaps mercedesae]
MPRRPRVSFCVRHTSRRRIHGEYEDMFDLHVSVSNTVSNPFGCGIRLRNQEPTASRTLEEICSYLLTGTNQRSDRV